MVQQPGKIRLRHRVDLLDAPPLVFGLQLQGLSQRLG
jgi:hypothetical protein